MVKQEKGKLQEAKKTFRKKGYLLLKFDNVDETKMSNKHVQQNVTNG